MKKYLVIILFSIALNFSFQPAASVVHEKHRIAFEISSRVDKTTEEAIEKTIARKTEIRSQLFLRVVLADSKIPSIDTS